jgi:hypothetical protein
MRILKSTYRTTTVKSIAGLPTEVQATLKDLEVRATAYFTIGDRECDLTLIERREIEGHNDA